MNTDEHGLESSLGICVYPCLSVADYFGSGSAPMNPGDARGVTAEVKGPGIRAQPGSLPAPHAAYVHMDEIGFGVVANAATM
jgi:hypothetical protein